MSRSLRFIAASLGLVACSAPPNDVSKGVVSPVTVDPSPVEPPPAMPAQTTETPKVPEWRHNGGDQTLGEMVLQCMGAYPPEDGSGKCMCQGYEINPCGDGIKRLMIDRSMCGFICKPTAKEPKTIALRCPDGSEMTASDVGCLCDGQQSTPDSEGNTRREPMHPCAGRIASAKVTDGACVVTCESVQ